MRSNGNWRDGKVDKICPECEVGELQEEIERDEKSDGTVLGELIYRCDTCDEWFFPKEIEQEVG